MMVFKGVGHQLSQPIQISLSGLVLECLEATATTTYSRSRTWSTVIKVSGQVKLVSMDVMTRRYTWVRPRCNDILKSNLETNRSIRTIGTRNTCVRRLSVCRITFRPDTEDTRSAGVVDDDFCVIRLSSRCTERTSSQSSDVAGFISNEPYIRETLHRTMQYTNTICRRFRRTSSAVVKGCINWEACTSEDFIFVRSATTAEVCNR